MGRIYDDVMTTQDFTKTRYTVRLLELRERYVEVEANSKEEAEGIAGEKGWAEKTNPGLWSIKEFEARVVELAH